MCHLQTAGWLNCVDMPLGITAVTAANTQLRDFYTGGNYNFYL